MFRFYLGFLCNVLTIVKGDYVSQRQHLQNDFSDLQNTVKILDSYLDSQYKSIPSKIKDATAASISKTNADNHRYAQIASAIIIGRIIRNGAVVLGAGTSGLTLAQTAGIIGTFTDTTGYALSRGINIDHNPTPSCGISDWEEALAKYSALFNMRQIYSEISQETLPSYGSNSYNNGGGSYSSASADPHPEVMSLMTDSLEKELKSSLNCLLGISTLASRKLERCIDGMLETIRKRIHVTDQLNKMKHKFS